MAAKVKATQALTPRRGYIGIKVSGGEVVLTKSGRPTTPFPPVRNGRMKQTLVAVHAWLIENAIAEAEHAGNRLALGCFRSEQPVKRELPPASIDSADAFLFGEHSPTPVRA